jgi:phage-related protein
MAEAGTPFLMLLKDLMPVITPIVEQLGKFLTPIFKELAGVIKVLLPPFMTLFQNVMKSAQPIIDVLLKVLGKLAPVFGRLMSAVSGLLPALQPLIDVFIELVEDNLDKLVPLLNVLIQALIDLTPAISLAAQFTANLVRVGAALVNAVVDPIVAGIKYIISAGAEAAGWVASIFGGDAAKKVNQSGGLGK